MKGNAEVIEGLNEALGEELTAINPYFLPKCSRSC
jgi:bacterioferritin (cytochrome b1)